MARKARATVGIGAQACVCCRHTGVLFYSVPSGQILTENGRIGHEAAFDEVMKAGSYDVLKWPHSELTRHKWYSFRVY